MIEIMLLGAPIPAARPRVTRFRTYNPKQKTMTRIKREIKYFYGALPIEDPVAIYLRFFMPLPKSLSKAKKLEMASTPCTTRNGDIDNIIKMYTDCMNGIVYKDDSQIYSVDSIKVYSFEPRVEIGIVVYPGKGICYEEKRSNK